MEDQVIPTVFIASFGESQASVLLGNKNGEISIFDLRKDYPAVNTFETSIDKVTKFCFGGPEQNLTITFSANQGAAVDLDGKPVRQYFMPDLKHVVFLRGEENTLVIGGLIRG